MADAAGGWRQLFSAIFERSTNPMSLISEERTILQANAAKARLLGRTVGELEGKRIEEFVAPEDRERVAADWERARRERASIAQECELVSSDGTRIHVHYAAVPAEVNGPGVFIYIELPDNPAAHLDAAEERLAGSLTAREREVVQLFALGRTGPEIAAELVVSYETVRSHARNAMAKTGARTRAHLIAITMGGGLFSAPNPPTG